MRVARGAARAAGVVMVLVGAYGLLRHLGPGASRVVEHRGVAGRRRACCTTPSSRRSWSLVACRSLRAAAAVVEPRPGAAGLVVLRAGDPAGDPGARPVRRAPGQPDAARPPLRPAVAGRSRCVVTVGGRGRGAVRAPAYGDPGRWVLMARVLVVDDDLTVREVVVTYLRAARPRRRARRPTARRRSARARRSRPTWSCST